jgi:uncharacterized membrane protein
MPRLAHLALLLACVWSGYGAAGWLATRGHTLLADAAVLFACGMFGASIMLISQMYNIGGNPADGVLMWWVGTLFAGAVLRSNPALALAMILVCVWSFLETSERNEVHWPFLIGWALVTGAFIWQRWRPGLHLSALTLAAFVVSLGYQLNGGHQHGLFALQFFEDPSRTRLIALAAASLVLILGAIAYALSTGNRGALWIGYLGFSAEILALYGVTVGTILGTSLFFLTAAIIVSLLAYAALRLARRAATGGGLA